MDDETFKHINDVTDNIEHVARILRSKEITVEELRILGRTLEVVAVNLYAVADRLEIEQA